MKAKVSKYEVYRLFEEHDKNKDGYISYKEFFNLLAPFNKEYRRNLRRKEGVRGKEVMMGDTTTSVAKEKKYRVYRGFNRDRRSSRDIKVRGTSRGKSPRKSRTSADAGGKGTWGVNSNEKTKFMRGGKGVEEFDGYTLETKKTMRRLFKLLVCTSKNFDYSRALIQDHLYSLFTMMDKNVRGEVSLRDLGDLMAENGVETKLRELKALIGRFDINLDGKINLDELVDEMSPKRSGLPVRRRNRAF